MQEDPLSHSRPRRFRLPPIVLAIIAYFVLVTIVIGLIVSLAYKPILARFHYSRGYTWNQRKEFDKAIADYSEAIRLDPRYADAYYARAYAWNEKKQFDKAIADYSEAIRLDPRYADAYYARAYAWNEKKQFDKAITDYSEAIRLNPRNPNSYVNRGDIYSRKLEFKNAIADYSSAIRLRPNDPEIYKNRGFALSMIEENDKAIADYTEAIRLDGNDPYPHVSIAWIRTNCRDKQIRNGKVAVESATRACELSGWNKPSYLETLAAAYSLSGDHQSAVKWQTKANALHSDPKEKKDGETRLRFYRVRAGQDEPPAADGFSADTTRAAVTRKRGQSDLLLHLTPQSSLLSLCLP